MGSIFVIRHGETGENAAGIVQGPRIDGELNAKGRLQAQALSVGLEQYPLDAIYCSPLVRARQTASAVADARGMTVKVVPELYEMDFGECIGQPLTEVRPTLEQTIDAWKMGFPDESFPGGESASLAQHRIRPAVNQIAQAGQNENIAVVAHGRINRILIASILDAPLTTLENYPQANASITRLDFQENCWILGAVNDTSHLNYS